jgi:glycosyltransferase involved in cell wall biosynthesis
MNVLIISTTDILGGAAKVAWEIKTELESRGDTVSLFVADKRSRDPRVQVIPRSFWRKLLCFITASERFLSSDWILDTPEFKAADIVHCHNLHGRYFNLRTLEKTASLKPVVWTLHDEWALTPHCAYTLEGTEMKNGLYVCPSLGTHPRLLWDNTATLTEERNALYARTNFSIITPCQWLYKRTQKTALRTHSVHTIYNGIDTSTFTQTEKNEARTALGLPLDKKIILFLATAGKANTWKGWPYTESVIKHFKTNDELLFLSVGGLTTEVADYPTVEYRQHESDPKKLALYYSAADLLLFTSIAENFPLVILEAMSCGLPIVAFTVGGVTEVVTHQDNGYVAGYKNTDELIVGVRWVTQLSTEERIALSKRSSAKIKAGFDVSHMTEQYITHYKQLLSHD